MKDFQPFTHKFVSALHPQTCKPYMALRNKAKVNFVHLAEMEGNMNFSLADLTWIREPKIFSIQEDGITIQTDPGTDLWQRTYYGFQNDNAPV